MPQDPSVENSHPLDSNEPSKPTEAKLIPFLCYAKEDQIIVRGFSQRLKSEGWIDPWFDEEDILPGQRWEGSVTEAVKNSHAVIVFVFHCGAIGGIFSKIIKVCA